MTEIEISPAALRGLAGQSRTVADDVHAGIDYASEGWEPRSDPEMKAALRSCRQTWRYKFIALEQVFDSIAAKLTTSADTTGHADHASAMPFDKTPPQPEYRHGSAGGKEYL